MLPIVSKTGNTERMNFEMNTITAYCQLSKRMASPIVQWSQPTKPTQLGNIGSSGGIVPLFLACSNRLSNVVIDDVIANTIVKTINENESIGVLNSSMWVENKSLLKTKIPWCIESLESIQRLDNDAMIRYMLRLIPTCNLVAAIDTMPVIAVNNPNAMIKVSDLSARRRTDVPAELNTVEIANQVRYFRSSMVS